MIPIKDMKRIIKNEQDYKDFQIEVRNRQYETNPVRVDLTEVFSKPNIDWDNEYLEITRIDNMDYVKLIQISLKKQDMGQWEVDVYYKVAEFRNANIKEYDVILIDNNLDTMLGEKIAIAIADKTRAELGLMSIDLNTLSNESIEDERINGVIDKRDVKNVIDWLNYIEAKLRINKTVELEKIKLKGFFVNGFKLDIINNIIFIRYHEVLSRKSFDSLKNKINESKKSDVILYFTKDIEIVTSLNFADIIKIYKFVKSNHGNLLLLNEKQVKLLKEQMKVFKLNRIIPYFEDRNEAINCIKFMNSETLVEKSI